MKSASVRCVLEMHIYICVSRLSRRLLGGCKCKLKPPRRSERTIESETQASAHLFPRGPRLMMLVRAPCAVDYKTLVPWFHFSSPLWPLWLRSSVVSVLNSLTTIMGDNVPHHWLSYFCRPLSLLGSACNPVDAMTLPLQYWLVLLSGDPPYIILCDSAIWSSFGGHSRMADDDFQWGLLLG